MMSASITCSIKDCRNQNHVDKGYGDRDKDRDKHRDKHRDKDKRMKTDKLENGDKKGADAPREPKKKKVFIRRQNPAHKPLSFDELLALAAKKKEEATEATKVKAAMCVVLKGEEGGRGGA